jgi:serine/threonine protein phosphatase PrpC
MDNRVDGQLAMSRALGDFHFKGNESIARSKQKVSCIPEVQVHKRDPTDRLLLICCDGVFDVMSNEAAVTNVLERYEEYKKDSMSKNVPNIAEKLAEDLIDDALEKGSYDNISAIVCLLPGSVAPFPTDSD